MYTRIADCRLMLRLAQANQHRLLRIKINEAETDILVLANATGERYVIGYWGMFEYMSTRGLLFSRYFWL